MDTNERVDRLEDALADLVQAIRIRSTFNRYHEKPGVVEANKRLMGFLAAIRSERASAPRHGREVSDPNDDRSTYLTHGPGDPTKAIELGNAAVGLHKVLIDAGEELARDYGYRPSYAREVAEFGVSMSLLKQAGISEDFSRLAALGRLDMTVEAFALRPEFKILFTDGELLDTARKRLVDSGYDPDPQER